MATVACHKLLIVEENYTLPARIDQNNQLLPAQDRNHPPPEMNPRAYQWSLWLRWLGAGGGVASSPSSCSARSSDIEAFVDESLG